MPQTPGQLAGEAAHFGLQMSVQANCKDSTLKGRNGLGGFVGERLLRTTGRGVSDIRTFPDAQILVRDAWKIVSYARRNGLVTPITARRNTDPGFIFAQTEQNMRITLRTLLEWAGVDWKSLNGPHFDSIIQGRIDLLEVWQGSEGNYRAKITDYKTFLPSSKKLTERYRASLQMRLYALWAAWAFGIPPEKLADHVEMELLFIGEDGFGKIDHQKLETRFAPEDPLEALREVWKFLSRYHCVESAPPQERLAIAKKAFPPQVGAHCNYCAFQKEHCPVEVGDAEIYCGDHPGQRMYWGGKCYRCPQCEAQRC